MKLASHFLHYFKPFLVVIGQHSWICWWVDISHGVYLYGEHISSVISFSINLIFNLVIKVLNISPLFVNEDTQLFLFFLTTFRCSWDWFCTMYVTRLCRTSVKWYLRSCCRMHYRPRGKQEVLVSYAPTWSIQFVQIWQSKRNESLTLFWFYVKLFGGALVYPCLSLHSDVSWTLNHLKK